MVTCCYVVVYLSDSISLFFGRPLKHRASREPLLRHQEHCLARRNRWRSHSKTRNRYDSPACWKIATAELEANETAWWFYDMEMLSLLLALWEGNSPITHGFHSKGYQCRDLIFSLLFITFFIKDCNIFAFQCDHITFEAQKEAPWWPCLSKDGTQDVQTFEWMPWSLQNFECVPNSCTKLPRR